MKLKSLFTTPDKSIDALRRANDQNLADEQWRTDFYTRGCALQAAASAALDAFGKNPSDEAAEIFLTAAATARAADDMVKLHNSCTGAIRERNADRLRPLIVPAIEAIRAKLAERRAQLQEHDQRTAAELGLAEGDTTSPATAKLIEEDNRCARMAEGVDTATPEHLKTRVAFVLTYA